MTFTEGMIWDDRIQCKMLSGDKADAYIMRFPLLSQNEDLSLTISQWKPFFVKAGTDISLCWADGMCQTPFKVMGCEYPSCLMITFPGPYILTLWLFATVAIAVWSEKCTKSSLKGVKWFVAPLSIIQWFLQKIWWSLVSPPCRAHR